VFDNKPNPLYIVGRRDADHTNQHRTVMPDEHDGGTNDGTF
jgi:hypothetical protein